MHASSVAHGLSKLGTSYVDLYLVHNPRLANGNIPVLWREMERLHAAGKAKCVKPHGDGCLVLTAT